MVELIDTPQNSVKMFLFLHILSSIHCLQIFLMIANRAGVRYILKCCACARVSIDHHCFWFLEPGFSPGSPRDNIKLVTCYPAGSSAVSGARSPFPPAGVATHCSKHVFLSTVRASGVPCWATVLMCSHPRPVFCPSGSAGLHDSPRLPFQRCVIFIFTALDIVNSA